MPYLIDLIEMSMLPMQSLSMSPCTIKFPPESTIATFMGCPSSAAFFSADPNDLVGALSVIMTISSIEVAWLQGL